MSDFEWIRTAFLNAQARGRAVSQEALSESYYAELACSGREECPDVSELWINAYWQRLNRAGLEHLAHKARHPDQFWKALGNLHWM
jgi:hypothetical protein